MLIAVNGTSVGTTGAAKTMAPTSSVVAYTGGAAKAGISGCVAAVLGAVAFLL